MMGITKAVKDIDLKRAATGEKMKKRSISLIDESTEKMIQLHLFDNQIEKLRYENNLIVMFTNLKVKEYIY